MPTAMAALRAMAMPTAAPTIQPAPQSVARSATAAPKGRPSSAACDSSCRRARRQARVVIVGGLPGRTPRVLCAAEKMNPMLAATARDWGSIPVTLRWPGRDNLLKESSDTLRSRMSCALAPRPPYARV
ncbi:hypothetical protein BH11PLA1_BH11PLA1_00720 [soil metagenome]